MKKLICVVCLLLLQACASPRAWVQEVTPNGGIIGYQNYDPRSDNQARINALVHCRNHTMVWSGLKSRSSPPGYVVVENVIVPISGDVQWAEYHYVCNSEEHPVRNAPAKEAKKPKFSL